MKLKFLSVLLFFITAQVFGQIDYAKYFEDKQLRIDYYHTGDSLQDSYSFDELREEPFWGGSKINLIDVFNYGKYKIEVSDGKTGTLIYSHYYSTLFSEWQTTLEAKRTTKTFSETVVIPFPKSPVLVKFYSRDRATKLHEKFSLTIDPKDYFIIKEPRMKRNTFEVVKNGDAAKKVDIVIIPEGYTENEMVKFKADCQKFAKYLFNASPYKENKEKFNIWGIEAASAESGTDIPKNNIWKNTVLGSSFYTFDEDRYLMTKENKTVRDLAGNVPYDQIYILVNTSKYGGGSIYNHYSVCIADNLHEEYVFVHEFGHGFAFLADEYYTSSTGYIDFYPLDIEPLEANITTLKNFDTKWKNMVEVSTPIPTPSTSDYASKVGAFKGGGYMAEGIYRPRQDCSMKSISVDNFCPVCKKAITEMINFYSK